MKNFQNNFNTLIIIMCISTSLIMPQKSSKDIQKDIDKRNQELQKIKDEIHLVESQIETKSKEENNSKEIINDLSNKINLTEQLIETLIDEEMYLIKLISITEERIKVKEEELIELQNQLKNRVRYLYKNGREKILEELLSMKNSKNKIYRLKYLKILNEYENEIKNRINQNIANLKNEKNNLSKEKNRKKYLIAEKNKKYENLEKDKKLKKKYLNKLNDEKNTLKRKLDNQKNSLAKIESLISNLYKDKNESKKREKELEQIRAKQNISTTGNFSKMKGKLPWPTSGKIINKFGIHKNNKLNTTYNNIGIDILSNPGSQIKAVVDGVVTVQTAIDEYNHSSNLVIIRHGDGYITVYKNIKNIRVNKGDYVTAGQTIGNVDSNSSNENILHFEVWKDGKNINPEVWLIKE